MRREIVRKTERHLDEQLGMWTRMLPWRREIAGHIEEAYQAARPDASGSTIDDEAWQGALAEFGDVKEVAAQLRKEHWPQHVVCRVVAVVVSACVVLCGTHLGAFWCPSAFCFALGPMIALVAFDTCRGSTRWDLAGRIGIWGALCGALFGTASILNNMTDPSVLGYGLAVSLLSALYCVLFFTPRRSIVLSLAVLEVVNVGLIIVAMFDFGSGPSVSSLEFFLSAEAWGRVEGTFAMKVLAISCAGVGAGIARFGFRGVARHALTIGAGALLMSLVSMLGSMTPDTMLPHTMVAIGAMVLSVGCSHCVSDCSRVARRLLRS